MVYAKTLPKHRLTPLHHIAMRGNRDLMQLLLNEKLNLNARDLQVSATYVEDHPWMQGLNCSNDF